MTVAISTPAVEVTASASRSAGRSRLTASTCTSPRAQSSPCSGGTAPAGPLPARRSTSTSRPVSSPGCWSRGRVFLRHGFSCGLAPELIELVPDRAKTITHLSQLLREGCYVLASVILEERGSFPCVLERAGQVRQSLFERNVRHAAAPFTQTAESVKPRRISVPLDQAVTAVTFAVELVFKLQSPRRAGNLVDTFSRPPYGACRS